ncbi:MAG: penicillin-binding protein, partial [Alphaproteobacteria bacterium]|nr:penicillin-binding protein [Alphaproteobacteria bacterium]
MENLKSFFKNIGQHLLRALFWITLIIIISLILMILRYGTDLPNYKKLATYAPPVATRLYAADGSLLIEYAEERRVFIDYADMPPMLVNAFIAAEDKNFWHHPGVDIFGIIRAGANNIIRFFGGPTRFTGASTITQQVAKNFFLTNDRTFSRKIREAILALRLERAFSKEHIMTLYLNQIFLGAR